jgi:hypothetical protein
MATPLKGEMTILLHHSANAVVSFIALFSANRQILHRCFANSFENCPMLNGLTTFAAPILAQ